MIADLLDIVRHNAKLSTIFLEWEAGVPPTTSLGSESFADRRWDMERIPAQPWLPSLRLPPPLHTRLARARRKNCHICQHHESGQSSRKTFAPLERAKSAFGKHLVAEKKRSVVRLQFFCDSTCAHHAVVNRESRTTRFRLDCADLYASTLTNPAMSIPLSEWPILRYLLTGRIPPDADNISGW